ncbi:MAG: VOC family protein [candidate division Zixibacteria bacterium]|nr:VOC family protein [candidate division Zixibacteria bacterium]
MRIGVVYYYVSDMNRALAFYRDRLGLGCKRVEFDLPHPWAELDTGGTILALEEVRNRKPSHRPPWGGAVTSFQVENIEQAKANLESKGILFLSDIRDLGKVKILQFEDPNGNLLELHQRI